MEITEILEDSFKYPIQDWTKILILGVLLLIPTIFAIFPVLALAFNQITAFWILFLIVIIIAIVSLLIVYGYCLSVTRESIFGSNDLPNLEFLKNIVDGLKLIVVNIVYYIIPLIVTIIVAYATGLFNNLSQLFTYMTQTYILTSQNATAIPQIPQELLVSLGVSLLIVGIVAFITFVLATLFFEIAVARLAETEKLSEIFNCKEIFEDIGKIGWGKYILWFILIYLILIAVSMILGALQTIPIVNLIISLLSLLLVLPFLLLFGSRALGLIYKESKE